MQAAKRVSEYKLQNKEMFEKLISAKTEKEKIEPVNVIFDSLLEPRRNELLRSCEK